MENSRPKNNMGLTIHTTVEEPQQHCITLQHQQAETESSWKVYSRIRGCRKQEAHISIKETSPKEKTTTHKQQQPLMELDTANTGNEGYKASMDSALLCHKPQPEHRKTSQIKNGVSTNLIKEAASQWELTKEMGMACEIDQAKIIDKITAMENRDRKEAEILGNRTNLP